MLHIGLILGLILGYVGHAFGASQGVRDGVVDVSAWNGQESIDLSGTWRSAENRLIEGPDIATMPAEQWTEIPVPTLSSYKAEGDQSLLQRTYVLEIKGLRGEQSRSIYFPSMGLISYRVLFYHLESKTQYVLGEFGRVDRDPKQRVHVYSGNNVLPMPRIGGDGYLIIQTNAYPYFEKMVYPYTIPTTLTIGSTEPLVRKARRHFYEVSFVLGLFILMSIFNFALYLQRPAEKANLYLAVASFFMAWRYASTEGYISQLQGAATPFLFDLNQAGLVFAPVVAGFWLSLFLRSTYPKQIWRRYPYLWVVLITGMLGNTLVNSLHHTQGNWILQTLLSMVFFLYGCIGNFRAAWQKEEGAKLGLLGLTLVFIAHLNDFFVVTATYNFIYLGHYSLVMLIFLQSLIVGLRFALTFDRAIVLGEELKTKNAALEAQQAEITSLNRSLKEYNDTLEMKVEEKTRDIVSILNNIRQGILAIREPDGTLAPEHSRHLEVMLGIKKTEGQNVADLCLTPMDLGSDRIDQAKNALSMMIGEDPLAFELNQDALPREVSRRDEQGQQTFELDWSPVIAGDRIEKVLLVMRDVTEIKRLRQDAENQASELLLIADIINVPKDRFEGLIEAAERLIDSNRDLLRGVAQVDSAGVDRLYRNLHTVKGMMRTYQMRQVTDLVHTAEDRYKRIKQGESCEREILLQDLETIREILGRMVQVNRQKLGRSSTQDNRYMLIDKMQFEENLRSIREIDIQALQSADQSRLERIKSLFYKVAYTPLKKVLEAQLSGLGALAESVSKKAPTVVFDDPGISINRDIHEALNNVFNHLLRNTIDHGLETPEVRRRKGKPEAGVIHFKLSLFHDQLRIDCEDDGAGLNLQKIRSKAIEKGYMAKDQVVTRRSLVEFILRPDFSTAERVTDISGRGVGMDAVRSFVEEIHGTFDIEVQQPESTEIEPVPAHFVIILPENHFQRMEPHIIGTSDAAA
jgi:hypothetical protein